MLINEFVLWSDTLIDKGILVVRVMSIELLCQSQLILVSLTHFTLEFADCSQHNDNTLGYQISVSVVWAILSVSDAKISTCTVIFSSLSSTIISVSLAKNIAKN